MHQWFSFFIGARTEGGNDKEVIMLRTAYEHAAALFVDTVAQILISGHIF